MIRLVDNGNTKYITSTTIHDATSAIISSDTSGTISSPTTAITLGQIAIGVTPKSQYTPSVYNPTSRTPPEVAINESVMLIVGGLDINKVFFLQTSCLRIIDT